MEELKILGFENSVLKLVNANTIPKRTMAYILKDISQKLFEASNLECSLATREVQEKGEMKDAESTRSQQE